MPIETGLNTSSAATEIVFVENNLPDLDAVLAGIRAGVEVVLLDSAGDGLAQIADALRGRSNVDAIHIVSHGAAGALDLGSTTLSGATLAEHAGALGTIGAALAAGGDILLYGCDAGAGSAGAALLNGLASLTQADVAASNDPTGAAGLGGDWQLEAHTGPIEAALCFTDAFTAQYDHLLINARPTLAEYIPVIMGGKEDTPGVITFADILAAATVSDPDGTVTAFRIVGFYSGGTTFKVGTSLETAGSTINDVIIDATHNLYYTPPADNYSLPGGGIGMVEVVAVDNLGAQSFGSATVYVNLAPVNDAPSIGYGNYVQGVAEDTTSPDHEDVSDPANHPVANQGSDIASLVRNSGFQDKEQSDATGIAIAGNDADPLTQGRWQYSTDGNGEFWHDVGTVSAASALLLPASGAAYLRFVPVAEFSGKPGSLTVHAVDGSDPAIQFSTWNGTTEQRQTFDTTTDDAATSAVSPSGVEWQTEVYGVNDLPVFTGLGAADNQTVFASDAAVLVDKTQDIAVTDVDSPDFENGYLDIKIASGRGAGDVLAVREDADVTLSSGMNFNSIISVGGVAVGQIGYGATGAGQDLAIYLMGGATPANVATLLRHITFDTTGSAAGDRTVTMQVYDGDSGASAVGSTVVSVKVAPTVSITSNRTSLKAGDEAHIIFTFSEAPTDFDFSDITVVGGTLRGFQNIGNPRLYDAVFVPTGDMQSTSGSVSIAAGQFFNAQGTPNVASTGNAAMTVDTKAPTLTISADKTTVKAGETVALTFTFDEAPVGFAAGYVGYYGGALTNFQPTADNKVFTATFTPAANLDTVNAAVSVGANAYVDALGNRGTGSNVVAIGGDTKAPNVTITADKTALKAGDTATLTFTFTEAPASLATGDIAVSGGTLANLQAGADAKVYTATFTPAASDNLAATVGLAAGAYTDAAGNAGKPSNVLAIGGDTLAPGVVVTSSAATLKTGETATITFTFSEAQLGFDDADVQVAGGTLGPLVASANDPKVYTATFTPTADTDGIAASITVNAGGYTDTTVNAGTGGHVDIAADTHAPTLAISADKSVLTAGGTATIGFTFSEAPLHFDAADLAVSGGQLGAITATGDPKVFSATFTPDAADALNASVGLAAVHYTDAAGNLGSTANPVTFGGDTKAPTLEMWANRTNMIAGMGAQLTLSFSEVPTGFDVNDIAHAGGTLGQLTATSDPKVFTVEFIPDASDALDAWASVGAGAWTDAAGNAGGAGDKVTFSGDTLAPTVAVTTDRTTLKAGETATLTFTFSEAPHGFASEDIYAVGGSVTGLAPTASDKVYTATFTPDPGQAVVSGMVGVLMGSFTDAADNGNPPTTVNAIIGGDTLAPGVTVTADKTVLKAGETVALTFTFTEAPTGLVAEDIAVGGGTLTNFQATADAKVYTATFTPDASDALAATVAIAAGAYTDAAGNDGTASNVLAIGGDTHAPTVAVTTDRATLKAGETATISFTFSEAPQGFDDADVHVVGGTLGPLVAGTNDPKVYTATFTPTADADSFAASIAVSAGGYTDAAGNAGAGDHAAIAADTRAPMLTIGADKTALKAGETATVTFTFSEAPLHFDAADIAVTGGALGAIVPTADPKVYSATFTPAAADALAASIGLATVRYTDAAGNVGAAPTVLAFGGDTKAPTLEIQANRTNLSSGITPVLTLSFSEVPTGFDVNDIAHAGGTLGELTATADPKVFTVAFTPDASNALDAWVAVAAGAWSDASGNAGGAGDKVTFSGDTLAPTVTVTADRTTLKAGETATITFTFSETPHGFAGGDIHAVGGSVTGLAPTANDKVYTATFTPDPGQANLSAMVGVLPGSFTDAAGNGNPASAVNAVIGGDTLAPAVTDAHLGISGGTGTNGAFRVGDVVQVTWDNGPAGDANADVAGVTVDFSAFGGAAAVAAQRTADGKWTASFAVAAGQLDATGRNVAITVTDTAGNVVTRSDSSNAAIDNAAPQVDAGAIAVGGATGTGGTFRAGDTVTVGWSGEGNPDITAVKVDLSAFGGGAAVAATWTGNGWSATYLIPAGTLTASGRQVVLTATDDAGNATVRTGSGAAAIDNAVPVVTSIVPAGTPAADATALDFTVTLSEAVTGLDANDFTLAGSGATAGHIASVTGSGTTYTVHVDGIAGNGTLRLDLNGNDTGIVDNAGNAVGGYTAGTAHTASFNAAPQIVSNNGGASAAIGIAEGTTNVTTVVATDADHDTVSYGIVGGADAALFQIDAQTGVLTLRGPQGSTAPADSDHDGRYEVQVGASDGKGGSDTQALTVTVLRDLDGDGTADVDDTDKDNDGGPDSAEDGVPGLNGGRGDGNGDGIADGEQLNVASLPTVANGNPYATLAVAPGLTLTAVSAGPAPTGLPRNVKLPLGVLDFTIGGVGTGGTVTVTIYVDKALGANGYFKQNGSGTWVNIAKTVSTIGNKTAITFDLTDGGVYDSDHVANGRIVDPGGAALIAPLVTSNGGQPQAAVSIVEGSVAVTTATAAATSAVTWSLGGADAALFEIDAATGALRFRAAPAYDRPLDSGGTAHDNVYVIDLTATGAGGSDTQTLSVAVQRDTTPTLPAPVTSTVDGVQVTTGSVVNADGSVSQVITIPLVQADRSEQVGNNTVADIPLAAHDGHAVLAAHLPAGFGLQASGSGTARTADASLADLIREIRVHTDAGSHDQAALADGGSGFLADLAAGTALFVQTIVPGVAQGAQAPADALVISGSPAAAGDPLTALVIDGRGLPAGTTIQLQHVDFAAVVGAVTVTGGDGAQTVWGDGASQTIFLGADDDVLHGGAGNDTVGSAGGNDWIFGDEGDDVVFGGEGNDTIDGGSGHDTLLLAGAGRAEYSMRIKDGAVVMTHLGGGADGTDVVTNVEALRYAGQVADIDFNHGEIADLVRLYGTAFGRAADTGGINFWIGAWESGVSVAQLADAFMDSAEAHASFGTLSNAQFVARLYDVALHRSGSTAEIAWWTGQLDGGTLDRADVLSGFAQSQEKVDLVGVVTTSIETV